MEEEVIFIYCLADTIVKSSQLHDDTQSQMTHAEIITFVMISALYYQCNYAMTRKVITYFRYFRYPISKSRMVRRIHQLPQFVWHMMFVVCGEVLKTHQSQKFILDSFPVAACQNNKIFRCKLFTNSKYRGYTASKKSYFFGIKVHMTVTFDGIPVEFFFTSGNVTDVAALKLFQFNLLRGSKVYGDKAYNDSHFETFLNRKCGIELIPQRKKNSRRKNSPEDDFFLNHHRGRIETTFSEIIGLMPRTIRAKTAKGFLLKVLFFILGYIIKRTIKKVSAT